jgi:hypothetical protein
VILRKLQGELVCATSSKVSNDNQPDSPSVSSLKGTSRRRCNDDEDVDLVQVALGSKADSSPSKQYAHCLSSKIGHQSSVLLSYCITNQRHRPQSSATHVEEIGTYPAFLSLRTSSETHKQGSAREPGHRTELRLKTLSFLAPCKNNQ